MAISSGPDDKTAGLIARIKGILLTPDTEWAVIEKEEASVASLYRDYVIILAAIGPVATFLHGQLFGFGAFGIVVRQSLVGALATAVVSYVLGLILVYVLAVIVNVLAPNFQGQKDQIQALKLAVYSSTAGWLAGIFALVPGFAFLGILGLYSVYLFYRGIPVMMKSPPDKSLIYTAVVVIIAIVCAVVIAPLSTVLVGSTITVG